jgi:hypothetical protein
MSGTQPRLARWFVFAAALVAICVGCIIVAGLTSLVSLAERIHPLAGQAVFWVAICGLGVLALYGAFLYMRMPPALSVPEGSAEYGNYIAQLQTRLRANPRLQGKTLTELADIEAALAELSIEADRIVRNTASTVFLSTALMQNGRLDGLIVLCTQIRMV